MREWEFIFPLPSFMEDTMTRNTKLYKSKVNGQTIIYRTLSVKELSFLEEIENPGERNAMAAKIAITDGYSTDIHYTAMNQIGQSALERSTMPLAEEIFDVTVDTFRIKVQNDTALGLIKKIMEVIPNISIEFLLNQTLTDLIELICLCERMTGKKIFKTGGFSQQTNTIKEGLMQQGYEDEGKTVGLNGVQHVLPNTVERDGKVYLEDTDGKSMVEKMKEDIKFFKD